MDPLSIIASSIAIFDGLKEAYRFAEDVIKADSERAEFLQRLANVAMTQESIDECVKGEDELPGSSPWVKKLSPKYTSSSPLIGLVETMDKMVVILRTKESMFKKLKNFKWHSEKKALESLFVTIEGYCNQITVILSTANMTLSRDTNKITRAIAASLEKDRVEKREEQEKSTRKDIERWLSPLNFPAQQREIFDTAAKTGEWFIRSEAFQCWKNGRITILRCYGEAGMGKTMLSSIVFNHLAETLDSSIPVLCVFLEKTPSLPQTPKNILGSLLKQLVQFKAACTPDVNEAYVKASRINASPTINELGKLLQVEVTTYDRIHIIVDGLDESSNDTRTFIERELSEIVKDKFKLFTTSRPDEDPFPSNMYCNQCGSKCVCYYHCDDCPQGLKADGFDVCERCVGPGGAVCTRDPAHKLRMVQPEVVEYDIRTPDDDIKLYIRSIIEKQMPMKLSSTDLSSSKRMTTPLGCYCADKPTLFSDVVEAIARNVEGRFQLAKQFTRSLETKKTVKAIKKAVSELEADGYRPETLDKLYEEDMNSRIKGQEKSDAELAEKILSIVACVFRKLTLRELQHALATEKGETEYDAEGEIDREQIMKVTKGLVKIDKDGEETVRLEHLTWYEYFARTQEQWFPQGHMDLADTCLTYLNFDDFSKPAAVDSLAEDLASKQASHAFLSYALQHWGSHARQAGPEIDSVAIQYLQNKNRLAAYIQLAWAAHTSEHEKWDVRKNIHPLHVCAWFGLSRLLDYEGQNVDVKEGTYGQTPLLYACRRGNIEAARCLLKLGASINCISDKGRTPLMEAILRISVNNKNARDRQRSKATVQLLMDPDLRGYELDVNIANPKMYNRTAIMIAICRKQTDIALAILENPEVQTNLADAEGWTALSLASFYGMTEVVEALLHRPDIDLHLAERKMARTALWVAAEQNHAEILKGLLALNADPERKDIKGRTASMRAVEKGNVDVLKILFGFSFDIHCKDEDGRNLLHAAAEKGHADILKLLLDKGLDPNEVDNIGMTALHRTCRSGEIETATLLLESGADASCTDHNGTLASHIAWHYGHGDLFDLCKSKEVKVSGQGEILKPENLPLWSMVRQGRFDLVSSAAVCTSNSQVTKEPGTGWSVIHCAVFEGTKKMEIGMRILGEVLNIWNEYLDEPDKNKQTPLHLAADCGNLEAVKALLSHDPELDTVDRFGNTALSIAFNNEYFDIAVTLVEAGANIAISKFNMQKMLFAAVELQNIQAVKNLINAGGDRLAQDEYGRTLDQVARKCGGVNFLQYLQGVPSFMRTKTVKTQADVVTTELFEYGEAKHIPFRPFASGPIFLDDEEEVY